MYRVQTVNSQFQALDSKITSVGRTAVRIGESLIDGDACKTELTDRLFSQASNSRASTGYDSEHQKLMI